MGLSNLVNPAQDPSQRAYIVLNGLVYWNDLRTLLAHKALDQPNLMMTRSTRLISFSTIADSCASFPMPNIALSSRVAATAALMLFDSIPGHAPASYGSKPWPFEGSHRSLPRVLWTRSIALAAIRRAVRLLTPRIRPTWPQRGDGVPLQDPSSCLADADLIFSLGSHGYSEDEVSGLL